LKLSTLTFDGGRPLKTNRMIECSFWKFRLTSGSRRRTLATMTDAPKAPIAPSSSFQATFGSMTDTQLRETLSQISSAASRPEQFQVFSPQPANTKGSSNRHCMTAVFDHPETAYLKNLHTWSTSTTPPPTTIRGTTQTTRGRRPGRPSALASTPQPQPIYVAPIYHPPPAPVAPALPPNPPRPPIPTTPQALQSSYASRLRTGATLLMQPIIQAAATAATRTSRRGAVVNYADPGSGDDIPDAGELDSDDSDFQASGGTRTALRQGRTSKMNPGMNVFQASAARMNAAPQPQAYFAKPEKAELDQSYLGMIPPSKYIKSKPFAPTAHEYPCVSTADCAPKLRSTDSSSGQ
jgi:chromatin structure-remodeling complex subunit SFH1